MTIAASPEQFSQELELAQRLSPRKGNSAAGILIKNPVLLNGLQELRNRDLPTDEPAAACRAGLEARTTPLAMLDFGRQRPPAGDSFRLGARVTTLAALDAPIFHHHYFTLRGNALRIVAPGTLQGTALQEDGGPDTRPVVERILLDIKNQAHAHFSPLISPKCQNPTSQPRPTHLHFSISHPLRWQESFAGLLQKTGVYDGLPSTLTT